MQLNETRREAVADLARRILDALKSASCAAQQALTTVYAPDPNRILAVTTNTMVHGPSTTAQRFHVGETEARMILARLANEPFVARVVVSWDRDPNKRETIYVARTSPGGIGHAIVGARIVNYLAAFGRVAEAEAGDQVTLMTPGGVRKAFVHERVRLRPSCRDGVWDGLDDSIEFEHWTLVLESLNQFLAEVVTIAPTDQEIPDTVGVLLRQRAEAHLVRDKMRRRVVERMSLRDQPTLDRYQGDVFRMPIDRRLVLLGPPGTGKTTTLIRRLAQKRMPESLTYDEEDALERADVKDTLNSSTWAMFSPTALLKLYLREAFNRESVPASDDNLRTWEWQRLRLARNTLAILRSASRGRFQLDESVRTLLDGSSAGVVGLFEAFSSDLEKSILSRLNDSFEDLRDAEDADLRRLASEVVGRLGPNQPASLSHLVRILDRGSALQPVVKRLVDEVNEELLQIANKLVFKHRPVLAEIADNLAQIGPHDRTEEDEEDETNEPSGLQKSRPQTAEGRKQVAANLLIDALRVRARAVARGQTSVGGRAGRVLALIGDRVPTDDELLNVGNTIAALTQARALVSAPRQFVMGAPREYGRFRSEAVRDGIFFRPEATELIRQGRISPDEGDVVILAMLRNARRLFEGGGWRLLSTGAPEWLDNIRREYLTQVFVDEATDFSTVQLACTLELSHPRLHSWFACGDFNQRITENGVSDVDGLKWLERGVGKDVEVQHVRIAYRQSRRLRELVADLSLDAGAVTPESPGWGEEADVYPLLAEHTSGKGLAEWLANRIFEVESAIGQLPSIAVFVDGEEHIDQLAMQLRSILASQNVRIVGCRDGRDVGHELEVRVFDIRHIKGLEFEAVFFVGIDSLAARIPYLFRRFFYVGASRAATYLGVTCKQGLPASLERVRHHFSTSNWLHS